MVNRKNFTVACRKCGRLREDGERFSARGRCPECGDGEVVANVRELKAHNGPRFERWRQACAKAFGVQLVDDENEAA